MSARQPAPAVERFWAKVDRAAAGGCWNWTASKSGGYGMFAEHFGAKRAMAHRYSYEIIRGPIPAGLELDHLCRNKACVNPAHLEPVTHQENLRRGPGSKTHCKYGHEFTPENTRYSGQGARLCQECNRRRSREYFAKKREAAA